MHTNPDEQERSGTQRGAVGRWRVAGAVLGMTVAGAAVAHGSAGGGHGTHRHERWVAPPPAYAGYRSDRWADLHAIGRGRELYRQHCQACHGADGRGTGPLAASLAHRPADLTNHFHRPPHDGDAYLFWRVSEGGTVEPFRGMGSAMPAFKRVLSEDERWDVLAYVHAFFHLGLARWEPGVSPGPDDAHAPQAHDHKGGQGHESR